MQSGECSEGKEPRSGWSCKRGPLRLQEAAGKGFLEEEWRSKSLRGGGGRGSKQVNSMCKGPEAESQLYTGELEPALQTGTCYMDGIPKGGPEEGSS